LPLLALALVLCLCGTLAYLALLLPAPSNILILGIDRRPEQSNATRADTIILLHSDLSGNRIALLSIPRDLWVTIPGWGEERINAAHLYGELDSPGGGPALAAETINYNFGLPIHNTLRLDFDAFRQVIDAAGGIEIDVPAPIIDDAYPTPDYGVMHIEISAGRQHMDGETALQYARSRHGSSDLHRAARQQQILVALAKKISAPSGLLRAPRVYQALQNAVETDLSLRDLGRLALAWQRTGDDGLEHIVIDWSLTTPYHTPQGAAVLLPQWELINPILKQHFK
jgi:LCP family protein required for cell wall assembly